MPAPTTKWIKDSGTIISPSVDALIDELGNFFVDESGNNLLDSVSTDGEASPLAWTEDEYS